jgi:hypothetical protein
MFIREVSIDERSSSIGGKFRNEFGKDEGFLALECWKFEVVLLKDDDPLGKIAINFPAIEQVLHGVGICYDFSNAK